MSACSRHARSIAEVLIEGGVVLLHSGGGRCVAATHCAVDHVEACLAFVQPQLEAGAAASREVLCSPLDVEDAVGSSATDRGEYAKSAVDQIQVVPIRVDRVIVGEPRQALVSKGRIGGRKLRVAVGRQINAGKALVVQRVREGQGHGGHRIISMIANVGRARHDAATDLTDHIRTNARRRR